MFKYLYLLYCNINSFSDLNFNCCFKLHESSYDTGKALQALVKNPIPPGIEKKWVEEEQVICIFLQVKIVDLIMFVIKILNLNYGYFSFRQTPVSALCQQV